MDTKDTTVMEYTAEDLISHKLLRSGILVAKPKFDQDGADLLGLLAVTDGARFCRIQCKGRSLRQSSNSSVQVFEKYVSNAFILFLFVETGDADATHLFAFLGDEIKERWNRVEGDGPLYRLSLTASKLNDELVPYRFNDSRVANIKQLISNANVTGEFSLLLTAPSLSVSDGLVRFRQRPGFSGG